MKNVELSYFVFTILSIVLLACVVNFSGFFEHQQESLQPKEEAQNMFCSKNNLNLAVPVTDYEYVNNETGSEDRFERNGTQYGCPCSNFPCIRKCCPWGQYMEDDYCTKTFDGLEKRQKELFYDLKFYKTVYDKEPITNSPFNILFKLPDGCPENITNRMMLHHHEFHLLENGIVYLKDGDEYWNHSSYCLETIEEEDNITHVFICNSEEDMAISERNESQDEYKWTVRGSASRVSGVFFLLTFLIYVVLPELHNRNGICLMYYFLSMSVGDLCTSFIILREKGNTSEDYCAFLVFTTLFAYLCSIFWINIVSFDIWLLISGRCRISSSQTHNKKRDCTSRLLMYSIYAWGCPVLILGAILLTKRYPSILHHEYLTPEISVGACWFKYKGALMLFFYVPLCVLTCLNITMFVATVRTIQRKMNKKILRTEKKNQNFTNQKQKFYVCLKLFLVMGAYWSLDLIYTLGYCNHHDWFSFILVFMNYIQGIFVFLIFVCKRRVIRLLHQKYCVQLRLKFFSTTSESVKTEEYEMKLKSGSAEKNNESE